MKLRKSLLFNTAQLPAYWRAGRRVRAQLRCTRQRVAYGPSPRQYFLLLEPPQADPQASLPWAFYFHGGAWTFGRPEDFVAAAGPWLDRGFRVVLPSYRRPPRYGLHDIMKDMGEVAGAVYAFARTTERPVTSPPQLAGISAGGHLAAWLGLHPEVWERTGWSAPPDRVACFGAPLDLDLLQPRWFWTRYAAYNPTELLGRAPAFLHWWVVQGTDDAMVDVRHAHRFTERARSLGLPHQLTILPGGTHLDSGRWAHEPTNGVRSLLLDFIDGREGDRPSPVE